MPVEDLGERLCLGWIHARTLRQRAQVAADDSSRRRSAADEQQQIARRLGGNESLLRQGNAESTLDSKQQLHARQAVQAQILFEPAIERYSRRCLCMQLGGESAHEIEQALVRIGLGWNALLQCGLDHDGALAVVPVMEQRVLRWCRRQ